MIFKVAIPVPLNSLFDYLALNEQKVQLGTRVLVPFGRTQKVGFVVDHVETSDIETSRLKPIIKIIDEASLLGKKELELLHWASHYYHHPLGEVFSAAFPVSLRKGKAAILPQEKHYKLSPKGELLNAAQLKKTPKQKLVFEFIQAQTTPVSVMALNQWEKNWRPAVNALINKDIISIELQAKVAYQKSTSTEKPLQANKQQLEAIEQLSSNLGRFSVSLLEGVTGSGKTEVYMQVIQEVLEKGQQIIVLLPEITLTPQLEARFRLRFSVSISISHSKLSETQRHCDWLEMIISAQEYEV